MTKICYSETRENIRTLRVFVKKASLPAQFLRLVSLNGHNSAPAICTLKSRHQSFEHLSYEVELT